MCKNGKRIVALLLAAAMLLSLAACAKQQPVMEEPENGWPSQQLQVPEQEHPAPEQTEKPVQPSEEAVPETTAPRADQGQDKTQEKPANQGSQTGTRPTGNAQPPKAEQDRESMEQIVELLEKVTPGGTGLTDDQISNLDDDSLNKLVSDLLEKTEDRPSVTPGTQEEEVLPDLDMGEGKEGYDENGAMEVPFDQLYPDVVAQEQVEFDTETLLIKMANSFGGVLSQGMKNAGVAALEPIVPMETATWYEAKLVKGTNIAQAVDALRALSEIQMVDYNYRVETAAMADYEELPADWAGNPQAGEQWYLNYCGIPSGEARLTIPGGSSSVVVAVIDTGVDYTHQDLAENIWVNTGEVPDNGIDDDNNGYVDDYYGVDIVAGQGSGNDDNGHGTHVAGIIAARNNNLGVVGMAYNVKIMPVKAAMASGYLNQSDIAKAILYAYEHGAEVINMSFGGAACSIAVQDALAVAYTRCVLVASAGNDGMPNENRIPCLPNYPAALTYVLGVMSVNQAGRESGFTNWDVELYSSYEYELYAPGESMLSTIPGDRYASWSGTSMAAPVVAAMAALLRSEYTDRDTYPTKFIYGQLVATSENHAACLDPKVHGQHNLPPVVNLYKALTVMPKPDVGLQDYALFDTEGMAQDAAGVNSGEGVIDAGETIALGLTLRNRWGMSEDTIVKIDTLSSAGIADPYITIHNPEVNYGSVGTYSTGNCGAIYTDGLLTGWENPFYITIAENCPNDYIFRLNVTITCGNALDEGDTATYLNDDGTIELMVRNGTILPRIIEEDMILTAENLYIIPNATTIKQGVTVRVEPGTHIQFWSNDRDDPYAEDYMAYLRVEGRFLVNGTKDNPVYIFPSDLMSNFVVDFGVVGSGVVELRYADVTNYNISSAASEVKGITYAFGCVFRQNYAGYMNRRHVSGGIVHTINENVVSFGTMTLVEDSIFYKCGSIYGIATLDGKAVRCLFQDSGFEFQEGGTTFGRTIVLKNCVFQGNYLLDQTNPDRIVNTTHEVGMYSNINYDKSVYKPACGSIYVFSPYGAVKDLIEDYYGAGYAIFETEEELADLVNAGMVSGHYYDVGIRYDEETRTYLWSDGTPVGDFLLPLEGEGDDAPLIRNGKLTTDNKDSYTAPRVLMEIPGPIVPDEITFPEYEILMNTRETYQLSPICAPLALPADLLLYESKNESVITISESGLLTPVGTGTADVYVYSADKAVYSYVTVTVQEYVALENMELVAPELSMEVGTSAVVDCQLLPADTTSRNVIWTSSDSTVATVDAFGNVNAVGVGTAKITASCSGLSDTLEVTVWKKTETLSIRNIATTASVAGGAVELPEVTVSENSNTVLYWESTDSEVAVIENGKLIPRQAGTTTVRVTDLRSGLSDQILYYVSGEAMPVIKKILPTCYNGTWSMHILYSDGKLYSWSHSSDGYIELENIRDFTVYRDTTIVTGFAIKDDNTLIEFSFGYSGNLTVQDTIYYDFVDKNPVQVYSNDDEGCFVLLEDGTVYTNTGANYYGQAGVGHKNELTGWEKVLIEEPVVKVTGSTLFLTESGNLYAAGGYELQATTPTLIARNVSYVEGSQYVSNGYYGQFGTTGGEMTNVIWDYDMWRISANMGGTYGLRDDAIYRMSYGDGSNASVVFDGLEGIVDFGVYTCNAMPANFYIATSDGLLYHLCEDELKVVALRPIENDTIKLTGTNLNGSCLEGNELELTFSNVLTNANVSLYEDGILINCQKQIDRNKLTITCALGFAEGKEYRVVLTPAGLISDSGAVLPEEQEVSFVYRTCTGTATELAIHMDMLTFTMEDRFGDLPPVYATDRAALDLVWASSDPGVAEVLGGKLAIKRLGTTSLTVTDRNSGLRASIPVLVMENGIAEDTLNLTGTNLNYSWLSGERLELVFDKVLHSAGLVLYKNGEELKAEVTIDGNRIHVLPEGGFETGAMYRLVAEENAFFGIGSEFFENGFELSFLCSSNEEKVPLVRESVRDTNVIRLQENFKEILVNLQKELQYSYFFTGNAILNRITTDTDVSHWFRVLAYDTSSAEYPLGGNWWGTTNETAIEMQMVDYLDFTNYGRLMYKPYLTEAPENTFPFITDVSILNANGEKVTEVSNEEITVRVTFNRDMDTSIPLTVRFGSAYPYGDYEIDGTYVNARTWEGVYTLTTLIENGNQLFSIADGCSATEDLDFIIDWGRFGFVIDTTAAQALIMQGNATDTGIHLTWTQDDFDTLMGYNVYRSTSEDGYYQRINSTVIPADQMEFFDDTVEPGVVYYYNFTVVQTDLSESIPSGKISIMSKDTMAPDLYHSPVYTAFTGANLVISATVTDNLGVTNAKVFYRTVGQTQWKTAVMNKLNDKYSAIIPADQITTAGLEYYIEATDGINITRKGSAETPYVITVQQAVDTSSRGDVNGDGKITNLDALMLLQAINDLLNLNAEQFARADLNGDGVLTAAEALRILQYVSGKVGDLNMPEG